MNYYYLLIISRKVSKGYCKFSQSEKLKNCKSSFRNGLPNKKQTSLGAIALSNGLCIDIVSPTSLQIQYCVMNRI